MHHQDPEISRIAVRNARAFAEAVQAPPPEVADDPQAYLAWMRGERPPAPMARPRPRAYVSSAEAMASRRERRVASLPRQREPRPPINTAMEANTERNRQLRALAIQIQQEGGRIPAASEPIEPTRQAPAADVSPQID
jgi:hypothetical protein